MNNFVLESICCIAQTASDAVMRYYRSDFSVQVKSDHTPVTEADLAAHHIITNALATLDASIPVISEEAESHELAMGATRFWLVDPIDGTKSFIRKEGEFTVNIGLIEDGQPSMGVIVLPARDLLYAGCVGMGAFKQFEQHRDTIRVRAKPEEGLSVMVSHSHRERRTDDYLAELNVKECIQAASSLKFCRLAEGAADLYPRFGPTMEWDTAAGDAILRAAGGRVETPEGEAFVYGKTDFRNGPFVAFGDLRL